MESKLIDYQSKLKHLFVNGKTLSLATINEQQLPEASLAPFIFHESHFWVFVSQLSSHTQNLLSRNYVSVLIQDNESSANPFTVLRASLQCRATIAHDNVRDSVLDSMTQKLGDTVSLLRQLPDFYLICLTPLSGRLVAGFGQAFDIAFSDLSLTHVNPAAS